MRAFDIRVGEGWDVHQLVAGRKLILGGVEVPHTAGLLGHSDADVLLHAITDALLGAAGLGDIGTHFPAGDPTYRGIDSRTLLRMAMDKVSAAGWLIANIDSTIVADEPRIAPHIQAIRASIAGVLGLREDQVSVKAKRTEGLGFTGTGEGMAAYAVTLLVREQ